MAWIITLLVALPLSAWSQTNPHASRIKALSEELRWHPEKGLKHFETIENDTSKALLAELDAYINEQFTGASEAADVQRGLDGVLGRKEGDIMHNVVFSTEISGQRFLIVGLELQGAGTNELNGYGNKICFRAYRATANKFAFVATTGDLSGSALVDLHAKSIPASPVPGEFWFIGWAEVPPRSPYTVTVRLYAFDGKNFRTVWKPDSIITDDVADAVQIRADRMLIVSEMPDWKSRVLLHRVYSLSATGTREKSEYSSRRR